MVGAGGRHLVNTTTNGNIAADRARRRTILGLRRSEWAIGATATGLNILANTVLPQRLHVPASLVAAAVVAGFARRAGASTEEQGLHPKHAVRGAAFGVAAATPIFAAVGAGLLFRGSREFYRERRIVDATPREAASEVLVRIPLGTALTEEMIFRGAALGLLSRHHSRLKAAAISSALFGLWHIPPTVNRIKTNALVRERPRPQQTAWVAGTVAATALAGGVLSWLTYRSQSIIAPWMVHSAANISGYAATWLAERLDLHRDAAPDGDAS